MASKGFLDKPAIKAKVLSLIVLDGLSDAKVAEAISTAKVSVTRQAITCFRTRYRNEIAPIEERVEQQITDFAISQKVTRIAGLQKLADEVRAVIDDRGMIERSVTTTEKAEIVRERFARELPAELRAIYHSAAEEMGQLPKPDPALVTVNVDNRRLVVYHNGGRE